MPAAPADNGMTFLTEPEPARGVVYDVLPGIKRIVASNAGVMTYHGTNTYLVDDPAGLIVVDPGPAEDKHVDAIVAATGGAVAKILLTHTHQDHVGALAALKQATGAQTFAFRRAADPKFVADVLLDEGDTVAGWTAIHTPGHAPDHLCFARADGVVLTGDHVMSFSSSVVSPPLGNMAHYFASLQKMIAREDQAYLPGHGPLLRAPRGYVQRLLKHRQKREAAIAAEFAQGPRTAEAIAETLYAKADPHLHRAAVRNVLAHLLKLEAEGRVRPSGEIWHPVA